MIVTLMRHLRSFRGPKIRVRCFLHIINLVATLIIRQLEHKKSNDVGTTPGGSEDDGVEDDIDSEDVEGDKGDNIDDNDIAELEELLVGEGDEDDDNDEDEAVVEHVRTAMNKVSAQP